MIAALRDPDRLTEAQRQERRAEFAAHRAIALATIPESEWDAALNSMALPAAERSALLVELRERAAAPAGARAGLAWLVLWDDLEEDGDAVRVVAGGYSRNVVLTKAPIRLAIPVPPGGTVAISGARDGGGGGVTLGVMSGPVRVPVPVLQEGQTIVLPVVVR